MNPRRSTLPAAVSRWLLAALAALTLVVRAPAQPQMEDRWLLVFDTSWAMKKRLSGVEAAVKSFFATKANGQLQPGDSVGVWTFNKQLRTGEFPLTTWMPEREDETVSNLIAFLRKQHYTSTTSLAALQPRLNEVIAASDRLTILIYCDSDSKITWSPYDDGINETFRKNMDERRKSHQPFVVVLRTQGGKYIGGTVSFPPNMLNLPAFPAPPPQAKPVVEPPPVVRNPVKPPAAVVPSLIIVGTNFSSNPADIPSMTASAAAKPAIAAPRPVPATSAAPVIPVASVTSNPHAAPATNPPISNPVEAVKPVSLPAPTPAVTSNPEPHIRETNQAEPLAVQTNLVAMTGLNGISQRTWLALGVGLFLFALALAGFLQVRARRRSRRSLITSSMDPDSRPPMRK